MLRINRQTDYAVRVLLLLAKQGPDQLVSTLRVHKEMLIPRALAQRIVAALARGGFITTYPGRDGGLALARMPEAINLSEVVEYFEGPLNLSDCLVAAGECPFDQKCPVRCHWARLQRLLIHEMEQITFAQLVQDALAIENLKILKPSHAPRPSRRQTERRGKEKLSSPTGAPASTKPS
jgi:Rrf2 family protein